ncbi:hypothetical protein QOZ80_3AG0210820 [Eleusine coracana subsp. coracana]|nr:hypothetical protein QOZ80_3AG0210820 [Eleusine coracana subsp. coracana]
MQRWRASRSPNPNPAIVELPYRVHSFGLSESKIICTDNSGLSFLYDAGRRAFVTMPSLHAPKKLPISFAVPNDKDGGEGLYVMERVPYPHYTQKGLFEVFVNTSSETRSFNSREWSRAGDWTLPFYGKTEYIPELNLWFGLSDKDLHPCASDLSSVLGGRKPVLSNIWRSRYPPEWNSVGVTRLANMGSGRFCILKYFETLSEHINGYGEPVPDKTFGVCTGLELRTSGDDDASGSNGKGKRAIRMINHISSSYAGRLYNNQRRPLNTPWTAALLFYFVLHT